MITLNGYTEEGLPTSETESDVRQHRNRTPARSELSKTPAGLPDVSVVIPLFNEEENLPILAGEIVDALEGLAYEVIFVDDGSLDGSLDVLRRLRQEDVRRRVFRLPRRCGQSVAYAAGFEAVRGPVTVTLDADLQNDPADIPKLLAILPECDMVSGIRVRRNDTLAKRVASRIANRVRNAVLKDSVTDVGCSLKAYRSEFVKRLVMFDGMHRFLPALLKMQGARIKEVAVNHRPRRHGRSKYTIVQRLRRTLPDLLAVRWMQSRWIHDGIPAEEISERRPEGGETTAETPAAERPATSSGSSESW